MKNIDPNTAASIAAFIAARGVTHCPAACATRTTGTPSATDRAELARRFEANESRRLSRMDNRRRSIEIGVAV